MSSQSTPQIPVAVPIGGLDTDQQVIDRIIRLTSLVSIQGTIDVKLDVLRSVTASWTPGQVLPQQDRLALIKLEGDLRAYLIKDDPLRDFTKESLDERLTTARGKNGRRTLGQLFAVAGLALAMYLLIPLPLPGLHETRALIATPLFFTVLTAGTLWFYFSALGNFKPELRKVIALLSASIIVVNIEFIQITLTQLFHLDRYPIFQFGTIPGLPIVDMALMFLALRIYAKLLGIDTRPSKLILGLVPLGAATCLFIPFPVSAEVEPYIRIATAALLATIVGWILVGVLARKIVRTATAAYAKSMRWLWVYAIVLAVSFSSAAVIWIVSGPVVGQDFNIASLLSLVAPQAVLLYSGYSFKVETEQ